MASIDGDKEGSIIAEGKIGTWEKAKWPCLDKWDSHRPL